LINLIPAADAAHARAFSDGVLEAALPEEAIKLAGIVVLFARRYRTIRAHDLIVLAAAMSAGFAALENLFYLADGNRWGGTAALRSISAVPSHIFTGVIMGACLAAARDGHARWLLWPAAYLAPVTLHGLYDFLIFYREEMIAAGSAMALTQASYAAYGFILVVIAEGLIASRISSAVLARAGDPPPTTRAWPPWHWMAHSRLRSVVWTSAGIILVAGSLLWLSFTVRDLMTPASSPDPRVHFAGGFGLFALYHGGAFFRLGWRSRRRSAGNTKRRWLKRSAIGIGSLTGLALAILLVGAGVRDTRTLPPCDAPNVRELVLAEVAVRRHLLTVAVAARDISVVPFAEVTADDSARLCSMKLIAAGREEPINVRVFWRNRSFEGISAQLVDPPG
jgi:hypothetical protein